MAHLRAWACSTKAVEAISVMRFSRTHRMLQSAIANLLGDANLNGSVDSGDLNNLALSWRQDIALWSAGDFNANGVVNAGDLNELALHWRESIPSAASAVPEPAAATLAVFVIVAVACVGGRRSFHLS